MQDGQQQFGGLLLVQPVDGLIQVAGEVLLPGFELFLHLGQLGFPGLELGFVDGVFFVIGIRRAVGLVSLFPLGWGCGLELTIQFGLFCFQLGQRGNKITEQEFHQLVLQRALLAGLVFQSGDDADAPSVDYAPATAGHQAKEVIFALVPKARDDAPDLERVEQADAFQRLAKTVQ